MSHNYTINVFNHSTHPFVWILFLLSQRQNLFIYIYFNIAQQHDLYGVKLYWLFDKQMSALFEGQMLDSSQRTR